jgi:hypothetical protein
MNTNATWVPASYEVPPPPPTLREKLKHLLSHHTAAEVYTTLLEVFQEDFAFYRELFQNQPAPPQPQPQPAQPTQPQPQPAQTPLTQPTKMRSDMKIRVVKKPTTEETIEEAIEIQPQPLNVDSLPDFPQSAEETQQPTLSQSEKEKEKKARIKREQAAAEHKKFQELKAQGINPESLLTKENLNTWVNTQGLSFTQIARDHVGIDAEKISEVAKKFGIQSQIAKKRAQIIASKRR